MKYDSAQNTTSLKMVLFGQKSAIIKKNNQKYVSEEKRYMWLNHKLEEGPRKNKARKTSKTIKKSLNFEMLATSIKLLERLDL